MYTFEDLTRLCNGKLLPEIEVIVSIFRTHITKDCEICKGNAFICELCDSKEVGKVLFVRKLYHFEGCSFIFEVQFLLIL